MTECNLYWMQRYSLTISMLTHCVIVAERPPLSFLMDSSCKSSCGPLLVFLDLQSCITLSISLVLYWECPTQLSWASMLPPCVYNYKTGRCTCLSNMAWHRWSHFEKPHLKKTTKQFKNIFNTWIYLGLMMDRGYYTYKQMQSPKLWAMYIHKLK